MSGPCGLLAILGATATGKSALAVRVAEEVGGEVINADAFAVYRGMDVGTAKPTPAERRDVPHHLFDVKEPSEPFSAGEFRARATRIAEEILGRGRLPILCGGTGFYARAFFEGLFEGPTRNPPLRAALEAVRARRGPEFLKRCVELVDPVSGANVSGRDAHRAMRLLEIAWTSGRPPSALFRERPGKRWERPAVKVLLTLPRAEVYGRIAARFQGAFASELPEEVRRLLSAGISPDAPGFAAIGYRETVDLVEGRITSSEWEERILRETRRFAKRQETWFRREPSVVSLRADRPDLVPAVLDAARALFTERRENG
jgi:tRNA dimethylallyltransferase